jgi:hypothetical protein
VTTIIRRYRRQQLAPLLTAIAAALLALAVLAGLFMVIWIKGGPQPVHEIVIAIPAPLIHPAPGRRA